MRIRCLLLACIATSAVSAAWPFKQSSQEFDAAQPEPEAIPQAVGDDYASEFGAQSAHTPVLGQPELRVAPKETVKPNRVVNSLPTPVDFFNGQKPRTFEYYDGPTYTAWQDRLVFRPGLFKQELAAILVLIATYFFSRASKDSNLNLGLKWLNANDTILDAAFTEITAGQGSAVASRYLREMSSSKYVSWVSGRKGVKGMEITFDLKARTDPTMAVYHFARGLLDLNYKGAQDKLTLTVHFDKSDETCIMAICEKGLMADLRKYDWSVRAFAPMAQSSMGLPDRFAVFHETFSSADQVIKGLDGALGDWLNGSGQGQEYFESLVLTDLAIGSDAPALAEMAKSDTLRQIRKLTMTLRLPSRSKLAETNAPLTLLINIADALSHGKINISQAEQARIRKRRQDIFTSLSKEFLKEQAEEAAEEARLARKKEQETKYNAMTPTQRKKADELDKKRNDRKASGKTSVQRR